jgi:hypothetical protein
MTIQDGDKAQFGSASPLTIRLLQCGLGRDGKPRCGGGEPSLVLLSVPVTNVRLRLFCSFSRKGQSLVKFHPLIQLPGSPAELGGVDVEMRTRRDAPATPMAESIRLPGYFDGDSHLVRFLHACG